MWRLLASAAPSLARLRGQGPSLAARHCDWAGHLHGSFTGRKGAGKAMQLDDANSISSPQCNGSMNPSGAELLRGRRLLVAEDNALIGLNICSILEDAGAEVLGPIHSVKQAQELAGRPAINCGVLDVSLRDGPVFPAAEMLRQKGIGIVFLTCQSPDEMLERDWPEAQIVTKPALDKQILQAVIAACCR
jgi:CheY-like chemotaxis protein